VSLVNLGTITPNIFPATIGIANSNTWSVVNGIGSVYSKSDDLSLHGFLRGGGWTHVSSTGVLTLEFGLTTSTGGNVGFRVSAPPQ